MLGRQHQFLLFLIFQFLIAGCETLPNRQVPAALDVVQDVSKKGVNPNEFIFCDAGQVGAWPCSLATEKNLTPRTFPAPESSASSNASSDADRSQFLRSSLPFNTITFNFDRSDLLPKSRVILVALKAQLRGKTIELRGYTDNIGTENYNTALALRRADAVKQYLVELGLSADLIKTAGYGSCCYLVANGTEEERSQNRRVEIHVM